MIEPSSEKTSEPSPTPDPSTQNDSRWAALRRYTRARWNPGGHAFRGVASLAAAAIVGYGLTDPSFTDSQRHTVFIVVLSIGLWITEAIPPFAVGLLIICFQLFALGTPLLNSEPEDAQKYLDSWSSSVIFLLLGGFFLAEAMRKTGLDREVFRLALSLFGQRPGRVLLGLMLTTTGLSMVLSNTATTAMMIAAVTPFLRTLSPDDGYRRAVLVGIPAAAGVGGMGTIIGSPPNAVAVGALERAGIDVSFLDWMLVGVPIAVLLCIVFWWTLGLRHRWGSAPVSLQVEDRDGEPTAPAGSRWIVLGTLFVTIGLWITSTLHGIPVATVSAIPVAVLTLTGVLEARDMRGLPWDTLMLVAGGLSLGLAIVEHQVAEFYFGQIDLAGATLIGLMLAFGWVTVVASNVMSNTAAATILIPVAGVMIDEEFAPVAVMIALSSSAALGLPVSTPPNAVAYSTGMVDAKDFRLGGLVIGIGAPVLAVAWAWILGRVIL